MDIWPKPSEINGITQVYMRPESEHIDRLFYINLLVQIKSIKWREREGERK